MGNPLWIMDEATRYFPFYTLLQHLALFFYSFLKCDCFYIMTIGFFFFHYRIKRSSLTNMPLSFSHEGCRTRHTRNCDCLLLFPLEIHAFDFLSVSKVNYRGLFHLSICVCAFCWPCSSTQRKWGAFCRRQKLFPLHCVLPG